MMHTTGTASKEYPHKHAAGSIFLYIEYVQYIYLLLVCVYVDNICTCSAQMREVVFYKYSRVHTASRKHSR